MTSIKRSEAYADAAIAGILSKSLGSEGGRNSALNSLAFQAGTFLHLVSHRWNEESVASHLLALASAAGLGALEAKTTIRSGLRSGKAKPSSGPKDDGLHRSGRYGSTPPMPPPPPPKPPKAKYRHLAIKVWEDAVPIPMDPDHPVRLWAAKGHEAAPLWPPDMPFPSTVRWNPRANGGSIVALRQRLDSLKVIGIQLIHIAKDGSPRKHDGRSKLSVNVHHGEPSLLVIEPIEDAVDRPAIVEGLADALAISSKLGRRFVFANLTDGYSSERRMMIADRIMELGSEIDVCLDWGESALKAGERLEETLLEHGIATILYQSPEGMDPAMALREHPFNAPLKPPEKPIRAKKRETPPPSPVEPSKPSSKPRAGKAKKESAKESWRDQYHDPTGVLGWLIPGVDKVDPEFLEVFKR